MQEKGQRIALSMFLHSISLCFVLLGAHASSYSRCDFPADFIFGASTSAYQRVSPPRAEMLVWFVALEKLKTDSLLLHRGIILHEEALCPICNEQIETTQHLFFSCPLTWRVWTSCFQWWNVTTAIQQRPLDVIEGWQSIVTGRSPFKQKLWNSLFFVVIWSIWYERNQIKFQGKTFLLERLIQEVKLRLGMWIKCFAPKFPYTVLQVANSLHSIWDWDVSQKRRRRMKTTMNS